MALNEIAFRDANQRALRGFDEIKSISEEDWVGNYEIDQDLSLLFICECADENCTKRINLTLGEYNDIHQSSKCFVLFPGHNIPQIEDVVASKQDYIVVRKHEEPPSEDVEIGDADVSST